MIAIDESGSMQKRLFNYIIDFVISMVKVFDIINGQVRIGVITFSNSVFFPFSMNTYNKKEDIVNMVDLLRFNYTGGSTFTSKALRYLKDIAFTKNHGDRKSAPNYLFLISDGHSRHPKETKLSATELKLKGVTIYTFGFGYRVNKRELCNIASLPSVRNVIIRRRFVSLRNMANRFIRRHCKGTSQNI